MDDDKRIMCVGRAHDGFLEVHFAGTRPMLRDEKKCCDDKNVQDKEKPDGRKK